AASVVPEYGCAAGQEACRGQAVDRLTAPSRGGPRVQAGRRLGAPPRVQNSLTGGIKKTDGHPPLHDPHLEDVAHWHPIDGTPEKKRVAVGCGVGATIETYDFIGFGTGGALDFCTA